MSEANCIVVPSLCYENSPTVIYEAFSQNLPVIASHLGGIIELLEENKGISFKPASVEDLFQKMIWAKKNPKELKKMTEQGFLYILNSRNKIYISKLNNIINNLI